MSGEPDDADDVEHKPATDLVVLDHVSDDVGDDDPNDDSGGASLGIVAIDSSVMTSDPDPSSRARDLISRDLLNELSHEPQNWHEGRHHASTPPLRGFDTPSDPGTPSPRGAVSQQVGCHSSHNHDGLMSIDQWDWKTDAPEFVPGSMTGLMGQSDTQVVGHTYAQQGAWTMQQSPATRHSVVNSGGNESSRIAELRENYEWQLRTRSEELRDLQQRMQQLEIETAQTRASFEVERRGLTRQISHYRAVLERYCIPVDEAGVGYSLEDPQNHYFPVFEPSAPSQWDTGNASGATGGSFDPSAQQASAFTSSSFQSNDAAYGAQQAPYGTGSVKTIAAADNAGTDGHVSNSLDSKMRQLRNMLQEGNASADQNVNQALESESLEPEGSGNGFSGGYIASTLRAMFPHATIRTKNTPGEDGQDDEIAEEDFEAVENRVMGVQRPARLADGSIDLDRQRVSKEVNVIAQMVETLETAANGQVDDRAMRALLDLPEKDQLQALQRTGELVDQQGGHCRNLSSILQSVCRKFERRLGLKESKNKQSEAGRSRRARRGDDDGHDAFDSCESEGAGDMKDPRGAHGASWPQEFERAALRATAKAAREADREQRNAMSKELQKDAPHAEGAGTPLSKRSAAGSKSWADIEDGDDDDKEDGRAKGRLEDENDAWTTALVDKIARKGFELVRRRNQWELKINMSQLEPPLTEIGMERYCQWLRVRLTSFRDEHGSDALWHCRGEVDFSHNQMTNQMVWTLLETLAQHEVHTALIKLFANRISQGGVLAICEFIRMNERADAVQELHLSHNEIDDESALELLRVLKSQRPKYPPRRIAEGSGELVLAPLWLRLNHNKIHDPAAVLRAAEEEGVNVCTAWDRQVCGTSKCVRQDCALAHLYAFTVQDVTKNGLSTLEDPGDREGGGRRRERYRREYGERRRHDRRE
mmetsp:Transcript_7266/g.11700  ORF Transcript_7266/g.11700 Transcript_7266/m.11700 type:complete len:934 (+) Transcript_7266:94-2895(+)